MLLKRPVEISFVSFEGHFFSVGDAPFPLRFVGFALSEIARQGSVCRAELRRNLTVGGRTQAVVAARLCVRDVLASICFRRWGFQACAGERGGRLYDRQIGDLRVCLT